MLENRSIAEVLSDALEYTTECVPENVVDVIGDIARSIDRFTNAIVPDGFDEEDAADCPVKSLTQAIMGMTNALCRIANAISQHH